MQLRISILLIAIICVSVLILLWTNKKLSAEAPVEEAEVFPLVKAVELYLPAEKIFYGRLQPVKMSRLSFEFSGVVSSKKTEVGNNVVAGEVLLQIESSDFANAVAAAADDLLLARAERKQNVKLFAIAEKRGKLQALEVQRLESLDKQLLTARSNLDAANRELLRLESETATYSYAVHKADIKISLAETKLSQARDNMRKTSLRAPYNGVVNEITTEVGDYVNKGQAILDLADVSSLAAVIHISNRDLRYARAGAQARLVAAGKSYSGIVHSAQKIPDPDTLTHEARIYCGGEGLEAGDIARVTLSLKEKIRVVAVPASAIQYEGGAAVYVEEDGALRRVQVRLGVPVDDKVVIEEGLLPGQLVVSEDVRSLRAGQRAFAQ